MNKNDTLLCRSKKKTFAICEKSVQQIWEKIIGCSYKNRAAKTASTKVVRKTTEATGELIGTKITEEIVKSKHVH